MLRVAWRIGLREAELTRRGKPVRETMKSAWAEAKRQEAERIRNAESESSSRRLRSFVITLFVINLSIDCFVEYFFPAYGPIGLFWLWKLWKERRKDGETAQIKDIPWRSV